MPHDTANKDAPQQSDRLRALADRAVDLENALQADPLPTRSRLTELIAVAHALISEALTQVTAFHASAAVQRPGAAAFALRLAFVLEDTALVSRHLVTARSHAGETEPRDKQDLLYSLHRAVTRLDTCTDDCRETARWIAETSSSAPPANPPAAPQQSRAARRWTPRTEQHSFDNDDIVLVSPTYLAGGVAPEVISLAFGLLMHGAAWHVHPERSSVASPDGRCTVSFTPHREDDLWWRLVHHDPYWSADFTRSAPTEAVAGVTSYLPQLLGDRRHIDNGDQLDDLPDIERTASARLWERTETGWASPDGHCTLDYAPDTGWRFTTSLHGATDDDAHWTGAFSPSTPEPLVSGFLQHLATDLPVRRRFGNIPRASLGAVSISPYDGTASARDYIDHASAHAPAAFGQNRTARR